VVAGRVAHRRPTQLVGHPNPSEPNELWIADADGANFWPAIVTHDYKDGVWWIPDIHDVE
jgi:hypothetical protein